MVDSNRIVSFDILKGGGILLVILGHIQIPYMLKTVIYSFHMPLFFFCVRLFLSSNQFERVFCKKDQTITDSLGLFCLFVVRIFVRFET
jgi:fucose 4-O-acetylase-like acetyltransferase